MSDFQALAGEQGREFDRDCRAVLRGMGYEVGPRPFVVPELGIEVDAVITSPAGVTYWCEFKGSWLGHRPGSRRTDTVKKALCDVLLAWVDEGDWPPFILLTSHMPKVGSRGDQMMQVALGVGALLRVININDPDDIARLQLLAKEGLA